MKLTNGRHMIRLAFIIVCVMPSLARAEHGSPGTTISQAFSSFWDGFMQPFRSMPQPPQYRSQPTIINPPRDNQADSEPDDPNSALTASAFSGGAMAAGLIGNHGMQGQDFQDFCHPTNPVIQNAARRARNAGRRMARRAIPRRLRIPLRPGAGPAAAATLGGDIAIAGDREQHHRLALDYIECMLHGEPPSQGLGISIAFLIDPNAPGLQLDPSRVRARCAQLYQNLTGRNIRGATQRYLIELGDWHEWSHYAYTELGTLGGWYHSLSWPMPQMPSTAPPSLSGPLNGLYNSPFYGAGGF